MSYHRQPLLAGIAVFTLVAGTGLASAQESSTQQSKQPRATQQMNQAPAAGKMGQSAQDQNHGSATHQPNQRSEESNRATKADKAATDESRKAGAKAERDETKAGKSSYGRDDSAAAQREGSQRARLTEEQRTRIRSTVINVAGAPRVASVDFDVTVGTVIPRGRISHRAGPRNAGANRTGMAWIPLLRLRRPSSHRQSARYEDRCRRSGVARICYH